MQTREQCENEYKAMGDNETSPVRYGCCPSGWWSQSLSGYGRSAGNVHGISETASVDNGMDFSGREGKRGIPR